MTKSLTNYSMFEKLIFIFGCGSLALSIHIFTSVAMYKMTEFSIPQLIIGYTRMFEMMFFCDLGVIIYLIHEKI